MTILYIFFFGYIWSYMTVSLIEFSFSCIMILRDVCIYSWGGNEPFREYEVGVGERFSSSRFYIYRGNKATPGVVGVAWHTSRTTSLGQSVAVVNGNGNDITSNAVGSLLPFSLHFLSASPLVSLHFSCFRPHLLSLSQLRLSLFNHSSGSWKHIYTTCFCKLSTNGWTSSTCHF